MPRFTVALRDGTGRYRTPRLADDGVSFEQDVTGCTIAQFTVRDPSALGLLGPDVQVVISDEHGEIVWTGNLEIPGVEHEGATVTVSPLGAVGNVTDLARTQYLMPYLVTRLDAWQRDDQYASKTTAKTDVTTHPNNPAEGALELGFPQGKIYPGDRARMRFTPYEDAGGSWTLGGIYVRVASGAAANHRDVIYLGDAGYDHRIVDRAATAGWGTFTVYADGSAAKPYDQTKLSAEYRFDGAAGIVIDDDDHTSWVYATHIMADRRYRDGTRQDLTDATRGAYSVRPSDIVEDVMWRYMSGLVDTLASSVSPSADRFDTLDFSDATTTVRDLLDYMQASQTGWYWRWGIRDPQTGLSALTWRSWPTQTRYLVPAHDAVRVSEPGGEDMLCDRVSVTYRLADRRRSTSLVADRVTYPDVADLPTAGRWAPTVELPDSVASTTNAGLVAAAVLDTVARRSDAAKVTIPHGIHVIDLQSGDVIPAHRMQAGWPVALATPRGRGILGHAPETSRLTTVAVDDAATTLTLGTPRRDVSTIIADTIRRRSRRIASGR